MKSEKSCDALSAVVSVNDGYVANNKNRRLVFNRLWALNYSEVMRIAMGISGLIVNSLTNLSFPWY